MRYLLMYFLITCLFHLAGCGGSTESSAIEQSSSSAAWVENKDSKHSLQSSAQSVIQHSSINSSLLPSRSSISSSTSLSSSSAPLLNSSSLSSLISSSASSLKRFPDALAQSCLLLQNNSVVVPMDALPRLDINTHQAKPIVDKEEYIPASATLTRDDQPQSLGELGIRGRGNTTWLNPKKPYRLKFDTSVEVLGMPANKHWVLLANYKDVTLLRNEFAFHFASQVGMEYAPRSQQVDLYLNNNYVGIYQLTEHLRIGKHRVNIDEMEESDVAGDALTGGYLMEMDFRMATDYCVGKTDDPGCANDVNLERSTTFCVDSRYGMHPICLDNPEDLLEPEWQAQRDYIETYLTDMEDALFSVNFDDPSVGYQKFVNVESVVQYYLINELFHNVDGAITSFWMYKKRSDKLFFGPIWDFDLTIGNRTDGKGDVYDAWHIRQSPWFERFFEDPAFVSAFQDQWNSLKIDGSFCQLFHYANARVTELSEVQKNNFSVWDLATIPLWGRKNVTYQDEADKAIEWLVNRFEWMDAQINSSH